MREKESASSPIYVSSSEAFELSEELKFPHEWNVIHWTLTLAAAQCSVMFHFCYAVNVIAGNLLRFPSNASVIEKKTKTEFPKTPRSASYQQKIVGIHEQFKSTRWRCVGTPALNFYLIHVFMMTLIVVGCAHQHTSSSDADRSMFHVAP